VNKTLRVNKQLLLVVYSPGEQNSQGEETITSGHLQHRVNKPPRVNKQLLFVMHSPGELTTATGHS
jgi:hypothetical protein